MKSFRVEAGSNTSIESLWLAGGDEKGSLESETVKYGRESHGTLTREWLRWRRPAAIVNGIFVLSSERAPHKNRTVIVKTNKYLVVSPRWVLYSKTDWPTDRRSNIRLDSKWNHSLAVAVQMTIRWHHDGASQNGANLRQSFIVSYCKLLWLRVIVNEWSIYPIIQSKTRYY
jgi:hypothetical protein